MQAYIGHGAGHSQLDKLKEAFGNEVEGFHTVDPPASQLIDPKQLKPGVGRADPGDGQALQGLRAEHPRRRDRAPRLDGLQQHVDPAERRAAAGHPEARRLRPDALAKAARETDIPEGGTMQGYGVKFHGEGNPMRGQNERAIAAVYQIVEGQFSTSGPRSSR